MKPLVLVLAMVLAATTAAAQCNLKDNFDAGPVLTWLPTDPANLVFEDGTLGIRLLDASDPPDNLEIRMLGPEITIEVDGVEYIRHVDPDPLPDGLVSLAVHKGGNGASHVQFDDFSIRTLDPVTTRAASWGSVKGRF